MNMSATRPYKLIVFDIDGTILDAKHKVCIKLKPIVAKLCAKGYLFTLVSARLPLSVIYIAQELGLTDEAVITLNGSFITNQQHQILYNKTFLHSHVADMLARMDRRIAINYYSGFDWVVENPSKYTQMEIDFMLPVVCIPNTILTHTKLNKITLMGESGLLLKAQQLLSQDPTLLAHFSLENYLEVSCKSISKFSGLEYYAKQKHIDMEQIIAFGDGENDISMLCGVGLGVAMGNAASNVKNAAHKIIGNHFEQGVANCLEQLIAEKVL